MDKKLNKIIDKSFSDHYYMLRTHKTWDYVEMVKQELLTELETYIDEIQNIKFKETQQ